MSSPSTSKSHRVVIVGRPNVGKSTMFNRLIGRRRSLVHDEPGVTRDRIEERAEWWFHGHSMPVQVTDTGGMGGDRFAEEIKQQVHLALHEADIVLFVLDSQTGLTQADEDLFLELQKSGLLKKLPVIAVVNKVDAEVHEERSAEFYGLGLETVLTVSSEHGRGFDDLKQVIADQLGFSATQAASELTESEDQGQEDDDTEETQDTEATESQEKLPTRNSRIAIIGRPNVGKSTLVNALLGERRVITSPIAGTTVDAVDVEISLQGKPFTLIDTAGIRRKSKTEEGIEVLSVVQTRKTLERADLAILVLDGETGTFDQDEKIGSLIEEAGCCVVLAVNKWDTQQRNHGFTPDLAAKRIREKMAYLKYAPMIFTSGLYNKGLDDLGELLEEVLTQRRVKISTHEFTEWVREEATVHNPMNAKFYMCHQTGRRPPTFVCHVNDPEKIDFSLKRHLVNALRKRWGYMGSPVRLLFVEGRSKRAMPRKLNQDTFGALRAAKRKAGLPTKPTSSGKKTAGKKLPSKKKVPR